MYEDEIYCLLSCGQNKQALDVINRCYEYCYVTSSIMALESVALARLGFTERALTLCDELFEIAAADYNIFHLLVEALKTLGKYSTIEKLCKIVLKYNNNQEEYLKILLNTYVRMLNFDLAQNIALKIFVKTKNQSMGILYCLFAIFKENPKPDCIVLAQKFMNKLDFSEFKPQIRLYLEISLLIALEDYDEIIQYFHKHKLPLYEIDNLELLIFAYVKKGDYASALNLLGKCSNKSLNMSIYEMDLCLISNVQYQCGDDAYLKLEYIKRRTLYQYLCANNKIPNSPDDLWSNHSSELSEYLKLLESELIKNIKKPLFFKYASNFLPFVNFMHHLLDKIDDNCLMSIINCEKIKIASKYFDTAPIHFIDERIDFFSSKSKTDPTLELALLLIEFHLIKYYRCNFDVTIICQLLNTVEYISNQVNSTVLYNILIDLYGTLGCIDISKRFFIKMNYKESLISTQASRFLHYSLISQRNDLVEKNSEIYLQWHNTTRCNISNSLVTAIEKSPHMIAHLSKLERLHSTSALKCCHLSAKFINLIDLDMDKVINGCKLYIDEFKLLVNGEMNWYYRNTTSCFSNLIMPTFQFSCFNSIPLITLMDKSDQDKDSVKSGFVSNDMKAQILPKNTTYFEEPQFLFPHKFYRNFTNSASLNDIITGCKYFPKHASIYRHTESALYKFNLETHKFIELETQIFVHILLLIYTVYEGSSISNIALSLKDYIATYSLQFNHKYLTLISQFSNSVLDAIKKLVSGGPEEMSNDILHSTIACIDECSNIIALPINKNDGKIDTNLLVITSKFVSLISLIPNRLVSVLKWIVRIRKLRVETVDINNSLDTLANQVEYIIIQVNLLVCNVENWIALSSDMDEVRVTSCRCNCWCVRVT